MTQQSDKIKAIIQMLPDSPGIYQYLNKDGIIIYVGKAKRLKRRVSSYFNKNHTHPKLIALVRHIHDIQYIVVNSEEDALHLENNLIKKYQPRYNILLKDGKSYPWLCVTRETFPRIFTTYNTKLRADYFGPYSSKFQINTILELVREIYPIRSCNQTMTLDGIQEGKYKVCLEYHIKNCAGICEGFQSPEDYHEMIHEIKEIARGNVHALRELLMVRIGRKAEELKFEEAHRLKQKYDSLSSYQSKTIVTTTKDTNIDIFSYDNDDNTIFVNILRVKNGAVNQGLTVEYQKQLDEPQEEILGLAIIDLRQKLDSHNKTILVPFMPNIELSDVEISVPKIGDKKKLLDLSIKNVKQYKIDKLKRNEQLNPEQRSTRLLKEIQNALHLDRLPNTIECFDNSNISGTNAVAACVVFKKAKPSKKDYRKYIIKTVEGPDDYASMKEVVYRRYKRMLDEGTPLPDLIITDGGKGQMEIVRKVIEDDLNQKIPIAGLAKDDKHRTHELLFGFPAKVIGLKPTDYTFKFLASIQDEVHRFAISFHRDKRSKQMVQSELDSIPGIGEKTKIKLLKEYKSLKNIKLASLENLVKSIGNNRASILYEYFKTKKSL